MPTYTDEQKAEGLALLDLQLDVPKTRIAELLGLPNATTLNNFVRSRDAGNLANLPDVAADRLVALCEELGIDPPAHLEGTEPEPAVLTESEGEEQPAGGLAVPEVDLMSATLTVTVGDDPEPVVPPVPIVDIFRASLQVSQDLTEAKVALAEQRAEHDADVRALAQQAADKHRAVLQELADKDRLIEELQDQLRVQEAAHRTVLERLEADLGRYRAVVMLELTRNGATTTA